VPGRARELERERIAGTNDVYRRLAVVVGAGVAAVLSAKATGRDELERDSAIIDSLRAVPVRDFVGRNGHAKTKDLAIGRRVVPSDRVVGIAFKRVAAVAAVGLDAGNRVCAVAVAARVVGDSDGADDAGVALARVKAGAGGRTRGCTVARSCTVTRSGRSRLGGFRG